MLKPTKFRWVLGFLMFLIAFMCYMDRVNLSVATPEIMKEFSFDKIQIGYIQTAFFLGYALIQIPGGIMADLFGQRRIIPGAVVWWSFFTGITAFCSSFISFIAVRCLFGMGEGPIGPSFNNFMARWFNKAEKGRAAAFYTGGMSIGPVVGPPLTVAIMLAMGWRSVFILFGIAGIILAVSWYWLSANTPRSSKYVNSLEIEHIEAGSEKIDDKKEVAPWRVFLKSSQFWAIGVQQFIGNYIMYVFLAWLPMYLMEARGFSLQKMGYAASLPWLTITISSFAAGYLSDKLVANGASKFKARTILSITGLVVCCFSLYLAAVAQDAWVNLLWMSLALGSLGLPLMCAWIACMDIGGKFSASVGGWMNFWGQLAGVTAPTITAWVATKHGWETAIIFTSLTAIVGIVAWIAVKPDKLLIRYEK